MDPLAELQQALSRRGFLGRAAGGVGGMALAWLLGSDRAIAETPADAGSATGGLSGLPHFAPRAKRVIYLFQSGARRRWICSITSRNSIPCAAPNCRIRSAKGSG